METELFLVGDIVNDDFAGPFLLSADQHPAALMLFLFAAGNDGDLHIMAQWVQPFE
ncbi:MAG: hypothetical protein ACRYFS_25585 [Janthinobacterium lividum]